MYIFYFFLLSLTYANLLQMKKMKRANDHTKKDVRPLKLCHICGKKAERMDNHLKFEHKLQKESQQYIRAMQQARRSKAQLRREALPSTLLKRTAAQHQPHATTKSKEKLSKPRTSILQHNTEGNEDHNPLASRSREKIDDRLSEDSDPCDPTYEKPKSTSSSDDEVEDEDITELSDIGTSDKYEDNNDDVEQTFPKNWSLKEAQDDDSTDEILRGFYEYLTLHPGGAMYNSFQATTSVNRVDLIIRTLNEENAHSLSVLYDGNDIWNSFVLGQNRTKKLKIDTVCCYLRDLERFFQYLLSAKDIEMDQKAREDLKILKEDLPSWRKALAKKMGLKEKIEKEIKDLEEELTIEHVQTILSSEAANEAKKLIVTSADSTKFITMKSFTLARDYLITRVIIENAQRSGVSANFKLANFKASRAQTDDGLYPVTVAKNKTGAQYGAAVVMLTPELHKLIRSEEHTSELQSRQYLVCRLLLEKKKKQTIW